MRKRLLLFPFLTLLAAFAATPAGADCIPVGPASACSTVDLDHLGVAASVGAATDVEGIPMWAGAGAGVGLGSPGVGFYGDGCSATPPDVPSTCWIADPEWVQSLDVGVSAGTYPLPCEGCSPWPTAWVTVHFDTLTGATVHDGFNVIET